MDATTKVIGDIQVTTTSEILFYLDEYKGKRFANIRKFSKSEKYTGPTKQGIKLTHEILSEVIKNKETIERKLDKLDEGEILRINKSPGRDVVVKYALYKGQYGFDIREMYKTNDGESFGKGIRIKIEHTQRALEIMMEMLNRFNDDLAESPQVVKEPPPEKPTRDQKDKKDNNFPDDIEKYF